MKPKLLIVLLLCGVAWGAALIYGLKAETKAKAVEAELKNMFREIRPLPTAFISDTSSSHDLGKALVSATYTTGTRFREILAHYDKELSTKGWQFVHENSVRNWGSDFGGKGVLYRQGPYNATLQYAGEKANYGWTYAFSMSWGLK